MRLYRSKASIRSFINEEKRNCCEIAEFIGRFSGGPLRRNLKRSGIIFSDIVFAPPFYSEAQGTMTNLIQRKTESVKEWTRRREKHVRSKAVDYLVWGYLRPAALSHLQPPRRNNENTNEKPKTCSKLSFALVALQTRSDISDEGSELHGLQNGNVRMWAIFQPVEK